MNRVYLFQEGHPFTRRQLFVVAYGKPYCTQESFGPSTKYLVRNARAAIKIAVVLGNCTFW
jgi:hypothetical protein